jgi:hypothetical protein
MATQQILSNFVNTVVDTPQTAFTATSSAVVIEAFTAANNSEINASYKAYIVTTTEQPQVPFQVVVWGEIDLGIGVVNQVIPLGAELKLESSALEAIYFTVTARSV